MVNDVIADSYAFVASLVQSLAWPVAMVIVILLLRSQITRLMTTVRRLRFKEFEADFSERLEKAEEIAEAANLPPAERLVLVKPPDPILQIAEISPSAGIAESWRQLDLDIRDALIGAQIGDPASVNRRSEVARQHGLLDDEMFKLVRRLRLMRNHVVHASPVDVDLARALEYIHLVNRVRAAVRERAPDLQQQRPLVEP